MNIEQVAIASTFRLNASRDDLEALKVALHQTYYYRNNAIPNHLQGVMSRLMDTVDAAIDKDDDIQRLVFDRCPVPKGRCGVDTDKFEECDVCSIWESCVKLRTKKL